MFYRFAPLVIAGALAAIISLPLQQALAADHPERPGAGREQPHSQQGA